MSKTDSDTQGESNPEAVEDADDFDCDGCGNIGSEVACEECRRSRMIAAKLKARKAGVPHD